MDHQKILKLEKKARTLISRGGLASIAGYSFARNIFLNGLAGETPSSFIPSREFETKLWGLKFRSSIMNSAGMFKNGEGYNLAVAQGAGGYIAGTVTPEPRIGNIKKGIRSPFIPYPNSKASSNWMGLPNEGYEKVAERISNISNKTIPLGISISKTPGDESLKGLEKLVEGINLFQNAGVDFIELNQSCPNTEAGAVNSNDSFKDLEYVSEHYLEAENNNKSTLPIIVKYSTDFNQQDIPKTIDFLIEHGYGGVNFGNTSTNYSGIANEIDKREQKQFKNFTTDFGGGISGRPLRTKSLNLTYAANMYLKTLNQNTEFHIIRTGGIENAGDLIDSELAGASMNMWFTGYFNQFSKQGHAVYKSLYKELISKKPSINYINEPSPL